MDSGQDGLADSVILEYSLLVSNVDVAGNCV
jgi:hypothetical protein